MIEIRNITKSFGGRIALEDVSLRIGEGELWAVLGANGAGKTTLLECLVGVCRPARGTITIDGLDRWRDHLAIRRCTAWLPDRPFAYADFTGREWVRLHGEVYGVPRDELEASVDSLLGLFHLHDVADRSVLHCSSGQFRKLALAAVLATRARLLILDEPFAGEIDPAGAATARELLGDLARQRGVTVVFSTQIVDQAERGADRIALVHRGRLLSTGSPEEITRSRGGGTLEEVLRHLAEQDGPATTPYLDTWKGS